MKPMLYITFKYWRKHKKSLVSLLFSGVLLCAVVCCAFLMLRQSFNRYLNMNYDNTGDFTYMLNSKYEREIEFLSDEDTLCGKVYCYGKTGAFGKHYTYGSLDDPYELAHIPIDKGRLPENVNEIAVDKTALNKLGFYGTVGDTITLDMGTYTLVGIINEMYGKCRPFSEIQEELQVDNDMYYKGNDISEPFPMIYIAPGRESDALYSYTMLDNDYPYSNDELYALREDDDETFFPSDMVLVNYDKAYCADIEIFQDGFYKELYHLYYISGIAAFVAVLSVIAVMRNIFAERENSIAMLRKIGVSKKQIRVMYTIECLILGIIQSVIGLLIGCAAHFGIYKFQVCVLEMSSYSGFTNDDDVLRNTVSPFIIAVCFSFAALILGYIVSTILTYLKALYRKRKKAGSLYICISRAVANRAVTVIQTFSLALICFGTVLGYMVCLEYGWYYNEETGEYTDPINTHFGDNDRFDFNEDKIAEYYSVQPPLDVEIGSFSFARETESSFGIDDSTASQLENAVSTGYLPQTFIICDSQNNLKYSITYGTDEEKDFFKQYSSQQGKALIDSGKTLYKCPTKLADINTIESLSQNVIQGEINAEKLLNGDEAVLVVNTEEPPLDSGMTITLGSSATSNGFGIESVVINDVTIGAVIALPKSIDRISKYATFGGNDYSLLTTCSGAKKLGLHNAAYTEIFAREALSSGSVPMGTGMTMVSYRQRRHEILIADLTKYGSAGLLIIVMSLLGFAAYFNGIGMKIRLKEYQISVMRAVGTPLKKLRIRLIVDSVKIPVAASALAFGGIKLIQHITFVSDKWYRSIQLSIYDIPAELEGNWSLINEFNDKQMKWEQSYIASHLIHDKLWLVPVLMPTLAIFTVMCIITILLTHKSLRMFTPDIASSLSKGRKRQ